MVPKGFDSRSGHTTADRCHGNSDADFGEPMYGDLPHRIRPWD
jgi:hypothetical protein